MTILITGGDGYIGWPTALRTASRTEDRVVLIDNFARREWVESVGSTSAVPLADMDDRLRVAEETLGVSNLSQINGERANYTQHNNMQATRNLLWGLHEHDLTDTHFIETTTTGVYGAPEFPIPEGGAVMENQGERDEVPFPALAGSWYHLTKSHDSANMRLANTQFDLPVSDVRTAITYGTGVDETEAHPELATRFDFDYYFGVVAHRFCAQAVAEYPMTVYGKGEQRKPFIALEDAVEGLAQLALIDPDERPGDHVVYNQVTRAISIVEIAETIAEVAGEFDLDVSVEHFENPREEDETHKMEIENGRYADLISGQSTTFEEGVREILGTLVEYQETIEAHEDRFLPGVLTDDD